MRILKVRVQNINSLKGNWSINFEDPAYAAGGLFAICGPNFYAFFHPKMHDIFYVHVLYTKL